MSNFKNHFAVKGSLNWLISFAKSLEERGYKNDRGKSVDDYRDADGNRAAYLTIGIHDGYKNQTLSFQPLMMEEQ